MLASGDRNEGAPTGGVATAPSTTQAAWNLPLVVLIDVGVDAVQRDT